MNKTKERMILAIIITYQFLICYLCFMPIRPNSGKIELNWFKGEIKQYGMGSSPPLVNTTRVNFDLVKKWSAEGVMLYDDYGRLYIWRQSLDRPGIYEYCEKILKVPVDDWRIFFRETDYKLGSDKNLCFKIDYGFSWFIVFEVFFLLLYSGLKTK